MYTHIYVHKYVYAYIHIYMIWLWQCCVCSCLQHSTGWEATWRETCCPPGWGICTRNTRRTRVFFRPTSVSPFLNSMSAFLSFRIPAQSILLGGESNVSQTESREWNSNRRRKTYAHAHCFHVVLWLQGDLQDFGAVDDLLIAGCRHGFTSDAVHLIKGVGLQDALISRTNEDLQTERVLASVAM